MKEKDRHRIVCASYLILLKGNETLLIRRFNTGYEDGKYSLPAGHVDKGESVIEALIRESKEEIGINVTEENITFSHVIHRNGGVDGDERMDFFFVCKNWKGEPKNKEPDKCDKLKWAPINDLPINTIPYIKDGIENSIKRTPLSTIGF